MRRPISLVRRSTEYAVTPYSPTEARTNANVANNSVSFAIIASCMRLASVTRTISKAPGCSSRYYASCLRQPELHQASRRMIVQKCSYHVSFAPAQWGFCKWCKRLFSPVNISNAFLCEQKAAQTSGGLPCNLWGSLSFHFRLFYPSVELYCASA